MASVFAVNAPPWWDKSYMVAVFATCTNNREVALDGHAYNNLQDCR